MVKPKAAPPEVKLPLTYEEAALKKRRERRKRRIETFELRPEEYDLLRIPSAERKTAWNWELSRECGECEVPYLQLHQIRRIEMLAAEHAFDEAKHPELLAVREIPLGQVKDVIRQDDSYLYRYLEACQSAHLLRIDWSQSKSKIFADFKRWIDSKPVQFLQGEYALLLDETRGKRKDYRAWLRDLGIYRISLKKDYMNAQEFYPLFYGKRSPSQPEWLDAIRRSERRIEDNVKVLAMLENYFALKAKGIIRWD